MNITISTEQTRGEVSVQFSRPVVITDEDFSVDNVLGLIEIQEELYGKVFDKGFYSYSLDNGTGIDMYHENMELVEVYMYDLVGLDEYGVLIPGEPFKQMLEETENLKFDVLIQHLQWGGE